jgi:hypothetical protein
MDTDDLTEMAYQSIRIAGDISEHLRCDIAVRSREYQEEDSYLGGIVDFLHKIVQDPGEKIELWNLDGVDT